MTTQAVQVNCPKCNSNEFELRIMRDEAVATARCVQCSSDYLILDSQDYWFDIIQRGYPRLNRCTCKRQSFKLRFDYHYREDGEIELVKVWSICSDCSKTKCQMTVEIDYGGTESLVELPLTFCTNPKLFYKLYDINLYATKQDMAQIADYLGCIDRRFICWIRQQDEWVKEAADVKQMQQIILNENYLRIYVIPKDMEVPNTEVETAQKEDIFWKHHEIIRISFPISMHWGSQVGSLYYIKFSTEFIQTDGNIVSKSEYFRDLTNDLIDWLTKQFVSWRGPLCFDNSEEHSRLFGDRFR